MSYCRFSEGDVYMYYHVGGFVECCACLLTPMIDTIFTKGFEGHSLFGTKGPCERCNGKGCSTCQMHGGLEFSTFQAALIHLKEHVEAGHSVPDRAFIALKAEIAANKIPTAITDGEPILVDIQTGETRSFSGKIIENENE